MTKNTTISERIIQITDFLGVSINDFAKKIGYNRSQAVYDVVNGKSKPSFDFFDKLYNSEYSGIFNYEWIITGKGEMLKQEPVEENILKEPEASYGLDYKEMYLGAKYTIEVQKKYIESLEQQLNSKRKAG
jgi:transcriptional regulator with XRE-family HTH domain